MARRHLVLVGLLAGLSAAPAFAHVGAAAHAHGLEAGLIHPLLGADHLFFMVANGVWSAKRGGGQPWLISLAFVASMAVGMLGGVAPYLAVGAEFAIAVSVAALGLILVLAARLPMSLALCLAAGAGLAHGVAHAGEAPITGMAAFAAGAMATTVALHAAGLLLGRASASAGGVAVRLAGAAMLLFGAGLGVGAV